MNSELNFKLEFQEITEILANFLRIFILFIMGRNGKIELDVILLY